MAAHHRPAAGVVDSALRHVGAQLDLPSRHLAEAAAAIGRFIEPFYFGVAGLAWDLSGQEWTR